MAMSDYFQDGAPVDVDNHPPVSEGYNPRSFGDPEYTPRGFLAADITGSAIDPQSDATSGLIELIAAKEKDKKSKR